MFNDLNQNGGLNNQPVTPNVNPVPTPMGMDPNNQVNPAMTQPNINPVQTPVEPQPVVQPMAAPVDPIPTPVAANPTTQMSVGIQPSAINVGAQFQNNISNPQPTQMPQQNMMSNQYNQNSQMKPKKSIKTPLIIIGVCIVIMILTKIVSGALLGENGGNHTNNTGYDYSASDVTYNCVKTDTQANGTVTTYVDLLFNYGSFGLQYYVKNDAKRNVAYTQEEWVQLAKSYGFDCVLEDCTQDTVKSALSSDGVNAILKKNGTSVTYSFVVQRSANQKASKSDIKNTVKEFENIGFKCK